MGTPLKLTSLGTVAEKEEAGAWVDVLHPAGGPFYMGGQTKKPFRVKVAGPFSKSARDEGKRAREERRDARAEATGEDVVIRRAAATLAGVTLAWEGAIDDEGKEIPLTRENAIAVYVVAFAVAPFITEQIDREGGEHARFFGEK